MSQKKAFINTYKQGREFGGHEEGGWWYDTFTPVKSLRVNFSVAKAVLAREQKKVDERNVGRRPIHSVLSTGRYVVFQEVGAAVESPKETPHYE